MLRSRGLRIAQALSARSRAAKHELFMRAVAPTAALALVDVGVADADPDGWPSANALEERYPWPAQITAVGEHAGGGFRDRHPDVAYVQADGRALPFADDAFDVAYSNAVVEHVGDADDQRRFLAELVRVSRLAVVTTPNRWFPVEVHTRLPLVHWLPRSVGGRLLARLDPDDGADLRPLGARELVRLFPDGAAIHVVVRALTVVAFASRDADAVAAVRRRLAGQPEPAHRAVE